MRTNFFFKHLILCPVYTYCPCQRSFSINRFVEFVANFLKIVTTFSINLEKKFQENQKVVRLKRQVGIHTYTLQNFRAFPAFSTNNAYAYNSKSNSWNSIEYFMDCVYLIYKRKQHFVFNINAI